MCSDADTETSIFGPVPRTALCRPIRPAPAIEALTPTCVILTVFLPFRSQARQKVVQSRDGQQKRRSGNLAIVFTSLGGNHYG